MDNFFLSNFEKYKRLKINGYKANESLEKFDFILFVGPTPLFLFCYVFLKVQFL